MCGIITGVDCQTHTLQIPSCEEDFRAAMVSPNNKISTKCRQANLNSSRAWLLPGGGFSWATEAAFSNRQNPGQSVVNVHSCHIKVISTIAWHGLPRYLRWSAHRRAYTCMAYVQNYAPGNTYQLYSSIEQQQARALDNL